MAERAWFAYNALERDERGELPAIRAIERQHGVPHNSLNKFIQGRLTRPGPIVMQSIANALQTSVEWLTLERGEGPVTRWPIPAYPPQYLKGPARAVKKKKPLTEELSGAVASSEEGPLHIAKRGAKKTPGRVGTEFANKSKPAGRNHKSK
jgi:hypothetical protein